MQGDANKEEASERSDKLQSQIDALALRAGVLEQAEEAKAFVQFHIEEAKNQLEKSIQQCRVDLSADL